MPRGRPAKKEAEKPVVAQQMAPSKSTTKSSKKANKKKKPTSFGRYIFKVLKQVHPDTGISSKTMGIMSSFVNDMFDRIILEAASLLQHSGRPTLSSREIQTSVRLLLPGELGEHAVSEGAKAVAIFAKFKEREDK